MSGVRITISVRNIVEFVLRSGNIDSGYMSRNRALEGTKAHQRHARAQKKRAALAGDEYESEVSLKHAFHYKEFDFQIEGRADGILKSGDIIKVEEVKSTLRPVDEIVEGTELHFAQARMYAYMYSALKGLEEIGVTLTYINIDDGGTVSFDEQFTFAEVEAYFFRIVEKYYLFAKMDNQRIIRRTETARALAFPHGDYRKGQRELAVTVYKTIQAGKKLFAQAPTGTGKTISALFPSVKALGEGLGGKIFYLTAKTITRQAAENAFRLMEGAGLIIRVVTITARDKICFCQERACNPTDCLWAAGHFDRINAAILDMITNETLIARPVIEAYARKHTVCPYELTLDAAYFCDAVICDYNYVYDPTVSLKRFFGESLSNDFIILCDEAHNFVERSREMFSAGLNREAFVAARKPLKETNKKVYKSAGKIASWFKKRSRDQLGEAVSCQNDRIPEELIPLICEFIADADKMLAEGQEAGTELLELYFSALNFIRVAEVFDQRYVFYTEGTSVKQLCLDPSFLLSKIHKRNGATVLFSATFTPLEYFRDVLGGGPEDFGLKLTSPFPAENFRLFVDRGISTLYKNRRDSYERIGDRLYTMISGRRGNYFVFFPSYEYLGEVMEVFKLKYPDTEICAQSPGMKEENKDEFLERFTAGSSILGFVVMGGIFSEGIDLAGDRLIGAAVVGVGMPMITPERNVIADYYSRNNLNGFNYAYVYPGMNKVMQAAGRVIRSETDRGVVLLIDGRFLTDTYRGLFPVEWSNFIKINDSGQLGAGLTEFWRDNSY